MAGATAWRSQAACRRMDPEVFFPSAESGPVYRRQVAAAKAVCARCPVRAECLDEALARMPFGIAGGLTAEERRGMGRRSRAPRPASVPRGATPAEVAATGLALLAAGKPAVEVARRCGVSTRTAQRWAQLAEAQS